MRRILFACAAVVPALVAGCTPAAQPTPSATPVPTVAAPTLQLMCTPEEGGTASPCTQAEYDAMVARDKLYDEAKALLAKYNQEFERLARSGEPASKTLLSLTGGGYTEQTRAQLSQGITFEGGSFETLWTKRAFEEPKEGSTLTLLACTDLSSVTLKKGDETLGSGRRAYQWTYFAPTPEGLKIVAAENQAVESC